MFLEKNLSALQAVAPKLVTLIDNATDDHHDYQVIQGLSGLEILMVKNEADKFVSTHSRYNPGRFNERLYPVEHLKDASFIILEGLSLEHDLSYILQNKRENSFIIVFEPSINLIRLMLERVDVAEFILSYKLCFITEETKYVEFEIRALMSKPNLIFMATHPYVITSIRAQVKDHAYFRDATSVALRTMTTARVILGNSIDDSLIGLRNIIHNLESSINSIHFNELKNKYANKPAVVVATGPSLDKNIEKLKQLEGKALIIAGESAIVPLSKHGIVPDAIIVLERIPESYDFHFKGRTFDPKTVLVGLTMMDPRIIQEWPHEKVLLYRENETLNWWFRMLLFKQDGLNAGESVSTLGFDFANYLGCKPICFVGLDLAFSDDGVTHSKEATYILEADSKKVVSYTNLLNNMKKIPVKGIAGDTVITNEQWLRFKEWIELRLVDQPDLCIDATEGGAYVEGSTVMTLQHVIDQLESTSTVPLRDTVHQIEANSAHNEQEVMETLSLMEKEARGLRHELLVFARKMKQISKKQESVIEEIESDLDNMEISAESMQVIEESRELLNAHFGFAMLVFFIQSTYAALYTNLNNLGLINNKYKLLQMVKLEKMYFEMTQSTIRERIVNEVRIMEKKVTRMIDERSTVVS